MRRRIESWKGNLKRSVASWSALALLGAWPSLAVAPVHAASSTPTLRVSAGASGSITLAARHWPHAYPVVVVVRSTSGMAGIIVQPRTNGAFRLELSGGNRCGGAEIEAHGLPGSDVTAQVPAGVCTATANYQPYQWTVVRGQPVTPHATALAMNTASARIQIRVGDAVQFWQPLPNNDLGPVPAPVPTVQAVVDRRYLMLLRVDVMLDPSCSGDNCGRGRLFTWIAVQPGQTGVTINPACRAAHPPCLLHSRMIAIDIVE